jgi:stage V sporulation protein B
VSEAAGCLLLYIFYRNDRRKTPKRKTPNLPVTHKLLHIAVPITAGRYIHTLLRTVENLIIPLRLSVFSSDKTRSLEQFGMIKGMAIPLLFFPASFLTAFSTLMIPEISEAIAEGRTATVRRVTDKSITITVIAATLIGGIFFVCGGDIATLLYNSTDTGILIRSLAPLVPFMYLESVCDGILKGLDQQKHSFYYGIIDSGSRIILIWFIVAAKGMPGFLLIMVYSNLLTSILNLRRLLKVTETEVKYKSWIILPTIAIILACTLGFLSVRMVDGSLLRVAVGGGVTAIVYLMFMYFTGQLNY